METGTGRPIAILVDQQISSATKANLTRIVRELQPHFYVTLLRDSEIDQADFHRKVEKEGYQLVLIPVHRYLSKPTLGYPFKFAAYFCESTPYPTQNIATPFPFKRIVLDFAQLKTDEILLWLQLLTGDLSLGTGIRPFIESTALVYCENWLGIQLPGNRADQVLALPEVAQNQWPSRSNAIRILLSAFWGLVYEETPKKAESAGAKSARTPKAYFQIGADPRFLVMRLCYYTLPHLSPEKALQKFWPNSSSPTDPVQLLLKYSDFLRVRTITETSDIEIVAGLSKSTPSEKAFEHMHTLWIEPASARMFKELPYEVPGPRSPLLRALPSPSSAHSRLRAVEEPSDSGERPIDPGTAFRIKELQYDLKQKEELIKELRAGGVGTASMTAPPDAEGLLEAFQQKYFDAKYQIRQFRLQIIEMEKKGGSPEEIEDLRLRMLALANREKAWIKKLLTTFELYKKKPRKSKGGK